MKIKNKKILVTGAAFIGVHLIKKLLNFNPKFIRVINITEKHKNNLKEFLKEIEFFTLDLRNFDNALKAIKNIDIVFHLAASHGGRGYVELKQSLTADNFNIDNNIFRASLKKKVEKIVYASSGCVYPNFLQKDLRKKIYLKEEDVGPPYDPDNIYGLSKLAGELVLKRYYKEYGLKSAIGRFFTVYGPYAKESHAVMATIAKAFIKQDPFEVWGEGNQIRNWTYVEDIADGIIKLAERVDNATAVNLGTEERISVKRMVDLVLKLIGHKPKKINYINMPTGPMNRVADISLAHRLLGWKPNFRFDEGLKKTIEWYFKNKNKNNVKNNLKSLLLGS